MLIKIKNKISRTWASLALLSIEMVIILILFFLALLIFVYLVRKVFVLHNNTFDQRVFDALIPYVNETNNSIMLFFTFLGTHQFLIPANCLLIAYFLFIKKHKWYSIRIPAIAISSLLLMFVLKNWFGRARPPIPLLKAAKGLSFPSGHALNSLTFYGLLVFIAWQAINNKAIKWLLVICLLLLIVLIGFSRIYLRVHHATDVIAGYCIGLLWLVISISVLERIEKYSSKQVDSLSKSETT